MASPVRQLITMKGRDNKIWEWSSVLAIYLIFVYIQIPAIWQGNYAAQDWTRHQFNIRDSAEHPLAALTAPMARYRVTPTFYHFINGRLYNLVGEPGVWEAAAWLNLLSACCALFLIYLMIRRLMEPILLRLSCFAFVTFLPTTVITSMVVASEAHNLLGFFALIWLVILSIERSSRIAGVGASAMAAFAFACKINFGPLVPGLGLFGLIAHRAKAMTWRETLRFTGWTFIPAGIFVSALYFSYIRTQTFFLGEGDKPQFTMTWRNLLLPKAEDAMLFKPMYFHEWAGKWPEATRPLHTVNSFGYPSMLHIALFTDFLNIYQPICFSNTVPGVEDEYYSRIRPQRTQSLMRIAVRTGLLFSLGLLVTLIWSVSSIGRGSSIPLLTLKVLTLALVLGTIVGIPSMERVYVYGGWLPRHIFPGIVGLGILMFYFVSRLRWKQVGVAFALAAFAQSALHISFLKLKESDYSVCKISFEVPGPE